MSAAAKPWKVQDERDRRSNMATSSINAPVKKDGGGGAYTWGRAMDVTDYEPVGLGGMTKVVTTQPTPISIQTQPTAQATPVVISDAQQFPALGSQPVIGSTTSVRWGSVPAPAVYAATGTTHPAAVVQRVTAAPPPQPVVGSPVAIVAPAVSTPAMTTTAQPTATTAPRVILGEDMLRAGVPTLDSTHPRNAFVRKPHHKPFAAATAPAELQETPAIDWTASGTTSFQQQVIHAVAQNPAHLGPYIEPKPGPTVAQLQATTSPVAYIPNQKLSKQVITGPRMGKPQVMFQRKC